MTRPTTRLAGFAAILSAAAILSILAVRTARLEERCAKLESAATGRESAAVSTLGGLGVIPLIHDREKATIPPLTPVPSPTPDVRMDAGPVGVQVPGLGNWRRVR